MPLVSLVKSSAAIGCGADAYSPSIIAGGLCLFL